MTKDNQGKLKKGVSSSFFLRAFILVSLKESYFFFRNLYGLVFHPFKTSVTILQKPDWSQTLLVFGLPGYLWFGALIVFIPVFWLFRDWYGTRVLLLLLFYSFTLLLFLLGCYLFFWFVRYFYQCKLKQKH